MMACMTAAFAIAIATLTSCSENLPEMDITPDDTEATLEVRIKTIPFVAVADS